MSTSLFTDFRNLAASLGGISLLQHQTQMYILTEKTSEAKSDIPFKKIWGKSLIVSEGK